MMINNTIQSPEGVSKLMEELWLRHAAGLKQPRDNMFWVDFPPLMIFAGML